MSMSFNPTIITEPIIKIRHVLCQCICWLKWFDFEFVQSMPQMLIYPPICSLPKWFCLVNVVRWPQWMPWIPSFWVLEMLVVSSSYVAIPFLPSIFHSNYLPMSLGLCWSRGTGQIRLQGVDSFFVGSKAFHCSNRSLTDTSNILIHIAIYTTRHHVSIVVFHHFFW